MDEVPTWHFEVRLLVWLMPVQWPVHIETSLIANQLIVFLLASLFQHEWATVALALAWLHCLHCGFVYFLTNVLRIDYPSSSTCKEQAPEFRHA